MQHTIGDKFNWAREGMADLLCENNLEVTEVTTDPDSSAGRAADSLYQDGLLKGKPTYKKKRVIKRKKLYELYKIHQLGDQEEIQYKKNVSLKECRVRGKKTEHNYSKTNK